MAITGSAEAKGKNGSHMFIEKVKKFIHQLIEEIYRLQNHTPNVNMTKVQVAHQETDLALTLSHLMIVMYRFVRKTEKTMGKQQMVLPVSSNLFQPLFTFPSTSVTTLATSCPPTGWDIVSNLNLHTKKFFWITFKV